ncbi:MAG: bifunctional DNA-formamidopyrimidine glycosylase/DNA-(apurinic or apyrimidinic site) lyase [Chloroflexales bacterium]|nr:bifunctional DNA-formamidopyrimidine glycosylase/DNA-(apurinic or apyrimidinic site) lyase [Chloroflexales bacterium]
MPELPEVEIAARTLADQVIGLEIVAIEKLDWERMVETPDLASFYALLPGRQIRALGRRAKWMLLTLDAGWTLALHLRMSGIVFVAGAEVDTDIYTHLVLALDDGQRIFFHDQRKFGRVRLLDSAGLAELDASHGPEPLDDQFTPDVLAQILDQRTTSIKVLLLDQKRIAGLGNIYANDALWLAQIHPLRPSGSLDADEIVRLHNAIRVVLVQAIQNNGSTLRNYRNGYGQAGQNQVHFLAYDRADQPCTRCGATIERIVVAQRSTYLCPTCQPAQRMPASPEYQREAGEAA